MKTLLKRRKADGRINPYPFLLLVAIILVILFMLFHFVFQNRAF